jgi:uncharacterized protein (UPF0212 family)
MNNRKKQQAPGLIQPYTVMLDAPVVVDASSVEEAVEIAKRRVQPAVEAEKEGDVSSIR